MFQGCTSLTQAPELPATTLASYCYYSMFSGCTSLNIINVSFSAWNPTNATQDWLKNVAPTGNFICPSTLPETYGTSYIPEGWKLIRNDDPEEPEDNFSKPLSFTANEDNSSVSLVCSEGDSWCEIEYSMTGEDDDWNDYET